MFSRAGVERVRGHRTSPPGGRRPRTSRVRFAGLNHILINAPGAGVEDLRERTLALVSPIDNHGSASA